MDGICDSDLSNQAAQHRSSTAVMFNPQYFRFDIDGTGDDVRIGNYPENGVEVENVR